MKTLPYIAAAALLPVLAVPANAKCLDEVHALAESHGVTSKPPVAVPGSKQAPGVTTHELQRSGGVIAPPQTADSSVIKPPANVDSGMATLPNAKPSPAPDKSAEVGRNETALQAALTAARASAERGDEQACEESLGKARQIAEKP
ncbi:MAG: hypothetical protein JOY81_15280 [Alphaproteobacteria bacterium]|nr:hypothetical protein [Alphaproteobacteria bacterium]